MKIHKVLACLCCIMSTKKCIKRKKDRKPQLISGHILARPGSANSWSVNEESGFSLTFFLCCHDSDKFARYWVFCTVLGKYCCSEKYGFILRFPPNFLTSDRSSGVEFVSIFKASEKIKCLMVLLFVKCCSLHSFKGKAEEQIWFLAGLI